MESQLPGKVTAERSQKLGLSLVSGRLRDMMAVLGGRVSFRDPATLHLNDNVKVRKHSCYGWL